MTGIIKWLTSIIKWFMKSIFKDFEANQIADKKLYVSFAEILPSDNTIRFLKNFDGGGPFLNKELDGFHIFMVSSDNPERQFIDKTLRKRQQKLVESIKDFLVNIGFNTWPCDPPMQEYNRVPKERSYQQQDRWVKTTKLLNEKVNILETRYREFLQEVKHRLKIPIPPSA